MTRSEVRTPEVLTLAELINARKSDLGLSFEQIAARAGEAGWNISAAAVHALADEDRQRKEIPRQVTLRGLAVGLDLPIGSIFMASARSVRLFSAPDSGDEREGPTEDTSADDVALARAMVLTELAADLDANQFNRFVEVARAMKKAIMEGAVQ